MQSSNVAWRVRAEARLADVRRRRWHPELGHLVKLVNQLITFWLRDRVLSR